MARISCVTGAGLGYSLQRLGFADHGQVQAMLTFADLRLFLTFVGGVVLCALGFALARTSRPLAPKPVHPGTLPGGVLFGIGWALTGACPSVPLVQLGEGKLHGLVILAGIVVGILGNRALQASFFRWDPGSCGT